MGNALYVAYFENNLLKWRLVKDATAGPIPPATPAEAILPGMVYTPDPKAGLFYTAFADIASTGAEFWKIEAKLDTANTINTVWSGLENKCVYFFNNIGPQVVQTPARDLHEEQAELRPALLRRWEVRRAEEHERLRPQSSSEAEHAVQLLAPRLRVRQDGRIPWSEHREGEAVRCLALPPAQRALAGDPGVRLLDLEQHELAEIARLGNRKAGTTDLDHERRSIPSGSMSTGPGAACLLAFVSACADDGPLGPLRDFMSLGQEAEAPRRPAVDQSALGRLRARRVDVSDPDRLRVDAEIEAPIGTPPACSLPSAPNSLATSECSPAARVGMVIVHLPSAPTVASPNSLSSS